MNLRVAAAEPIFAIEIPNAFWASAVIHNARQLSENDLPLAVAEAYNQLHQLIGNDRHIVRMWNYIPGITEAMPSGRDRYMSFNAGRFMAMSNWYNGPDQLIANAPAASGVGCTGDDLTIYALASSQRGTPVQNSLQVPAVHYSPKYGPRPPCFARATRVGGLLLVSGTAAIRGEDSIATDLAGQLQITLENLSALSPLGLSAYRHLHVYLPDPAATEFVLRSLAVAQKRHCDASIVTADLCRRDLLVEIEGVASDSSTHD